MKKGKILDFNGSWSSGISKLVLEDEGGNRHSVSCDNAQTVRSLERAYGDVIGEGHTINIDSIKGNWIYYDLTPWDTLAGFTPVEGATQEVVEEYKKSKEKSKKDLNEVR